MQLTMEFLNGHRGVYQSQDEGPNFLSNLRGNVITKLLEGSQKALQFTELSGPTGSRELLIGER